MQLHYAISIHTVCMIGFIIMKPFCSIPSSIRFHIPYIAAYRENCLGRWPTTRLLLKTAETGIPFTTIKWLSFTNEKFADFMCFGRGDSHELPPSLFINDIAFPFVNDITFLYQQHCIL